MEYADVAVLVFFIIAACTCFLLSRRRKYFDKTVSLHGGKRANRLFKRLGVFGYILGIISILYFIFFLVDE